MRIKTNQTENLHIELYFSHRVKKRNLTSKRYDSKCHTFRVKYRAEKQRIKEEFQDFRLNRFIIQADYSKKACSSLEKDMQINFDPNDVLKFIVLKVLDQIKLSLNRLRTLFIYFVANDTKRRIQTYFLHYFRRVF